MRDPEIVKQLTVKDFDYFMDHRAIFTEDTDPMFGKALGSLKGQKWKDMRATLSPAFTGSKMRYMFQLMSEVGDQFAKSLKEKMINGNDGSYEFKALSMTFAVDVIATTAFGIEVNSMKYPDNDFHRIAKKITNFNTATVGLKFFGFFTIPKIMKLLKIRFLDSKSSEFFEQAIYETMRIRQEKGIVRHDMINLMIQAKKGQIIHEKNDEENITDGFATVEESKIGQTSVKRIWKDDELAAQAFVFFIAGYDAVNHKNIC